MYPMTLSSHCLQTEKAAYPFCHENNLRWGNVSWIQREEFALSASTRYATDVCAANETYTCTWSLAPPTQSAMAPFRRATPAKHLYKRSCHVGSIHGWRR